MLNCIKILFSILLVPMGLLAQSKPVDQQCFEHVQNMVCESSQNIGYQDMNARCERPSANELVRKVTESYLKLPNALQRIMCSLDAFVIVDNHVSVANAFYYKNQEGKSFYGIAYSRRMLEANVSVNEIYSRYDSHLLIYPKPKDKWFELGKSYSHLIPQYEIDLSHSAQFDVKLFLTMAHELGHFLDKFFESSVSHGCISGRYDKQSCANKTYHWQGLSWKNFEDPSRESGFPEDKPICYYDNSCDPSKNLTDVNDVAHLYKTLYDSNFISLYSAASADEDFAESVAQLSLQKAFPAAVFKAHVGNQYIYDYMKKIESPQFSKKRIFIEKIFNRGADINRDLLEEKIPL